ncbi:D-galacturonic acid binding lectin [Elysia marginata]|uniref:D-galacturonic acid binding lectin n=1 Tax=Elysia marginata TaxID=1093978 RepID=A0AAV4HWC2_9GAST|nr:D-galacturonic acid binding lectin [Elysia marginata]
MAKFSRFSLLILVLAFVSSIAEAAQNCRRMTLNSNGYRYRRQTVSGAAVVNSMTLQNQYSNSPCVSGVSYGSYGADVWVNSGCRARFNICYTTGNSREVTCSSSNYAPATCHVHSNIRSVAVKTHRSNSPCVQDFSFRVVGSSLQVQNGCRATFVVGYCD